MPEYSAPVREMIFAMTELFDGDAHYKGIPGGDGINAEFLDVVLSEAGKFCANETNPIYQSGDEEGCALDKGVVRTPNGFQEAYLSLPRLESCTCCRNSKANSASAAEIRVNNLRRRSNRGNLATF